MSLAITWIVIVNLLIGWLAFVVIRAVYKEVIQPLLEQRKQQRERRVFKVK